MDCNPSLLMVDKVFANYILNVKLHSYCYIIRQVSMVANTILVFQMEYNHSSENQLLFV